MAHGGKRAGAGRKVGSAAQRTREIADAIAASGELTPLDYLKSIYQDEYEDGARRLEAAKAAAPYVHARLNSIEGKLDNTIVVKSVTHRIVDDRSRA